MSYVLTLVASNIKKHPLTDEHIHNVREILGRHDLHFTCQPVWLGEKKAVDLGLTEKPGPESSAALKEYLNVSSIDVFILPIDNRRKKLLVADMDSTIIYGETLDELADFAGLKEQVAEITEQTMQGQLNFESALKQRVSMLKGLPESALAKTLAKMELNPGATCLVKTMAAHGATCVLLSGGFSYFTNAVARQVGFHIHHGNILEITENKLTGNVLEPILGKYAKLEYLERHAEDLRITVSDALALGDGANDLPMLKRAGMGIGFYPKPAVEEEMDNNIIHGDLTAALYAQGYSQEQFYKS